MEILKEIFRRRKLSEAERLDVLELNRIINSYSFIARQVKGNTARVPGGQDLVRQYEALVEFLEGLKKDMVSQYLMRLGYPQGVNFSVDLRTGKIKRTLPPKDLPKTTEEPPKEPAK